MTIRNALADWANAKKQQKPSSPVTLDSSAGVELRGSQMQLRYRSSSAKMSCKMFQRLRMNGRVGAAASSNGVAATATTAAIATPTTAAGWILNSPRLHAYWGFLGTALAGACFK